MQFVLFTKLFRGLSIDEIGAAAKRAGFEGIDLLVRQGYIEPDEARKIRSVVRRFAEFGLGVPMVTTDLTDPSRYPAGSVLGACADAGVRVVRLGFWLYEPARGYVQLFQSARRDLDALEGLARKYGLRVAVQLHGGTIHCSGALAASLLQGHDPAHVGAYPDPGNQAVQDGREQWQLTFDLLRPWLCCVGIKNGGWFPADIAPDGQRRWKSDWLGIPDGMVPWDQIISHLQTSGYRGLLSFHSHYEIPLAQALDQTRTDVEYVRRLLTRSAMTAGPVGM